jgi:single-strand DNA-binding protein
MTDINKVFLVGRLTRDLGSNQYDFAYTSNGTAKADISIACNRSVKRGEEWQEDVSFFDITIWGKTAENLKPYLLKGKQVAVSGFLKQDRWEKNGQKFSKLSITAEDVQLLGGKNEGGNCNGGSYQNNNDGNNQSFKQTHQQNEKSNPYSGSIEDYPEDIPF